MYDKLVTKVNNIDTSGFVLKTKYNTGKLDLETKIGKADKKIPNTGGLVKKLDCNSKISEIESQIPNTSGLATSSALTAVENKIPNVSSLVKKKDYNTKISEIQKKVADNNHDKYIVTPELNKFTAEIFKIKTSKFSNKDRFW